MATLTFSNFPGQRHCYRVYQHDPSLIITTVPFAACYVAKRTVNVVTPICKLHFTTRWQSPLFLSHFEIKAAAEKAAADDYRSLSSLVEKVLADYLKKQGYLPDPASHRAEKRTKRKGEST